MDLEDLPQSYEQLIQHDQVIVTPNLGDNTMEAQVGQVNIRNSCQLLPAVSMNVTE